MYSYTLNCNNMKRKYEYIKKSIYLYPNEYCHLYYTMLRENFMQISLLLLGNLTESQNDDKPTRLKT